ncbi:MAG: 3-oxoacyl-[acyl-carrier protein] reductase, partial [uncultured Rubrobacteraceae bacterium]
DRRRSGHWPPGCPHPRRTGLRRRRQRPRSAGRDARGAAGSRCRRHLAPRRRLGRRRGAGDAGEGDGRVRARGRAREQRGRELYSPGRGDHALGVAARPGGQPHRAVPHEPYLRRRNARAGERQHNQRQLGGRAPRDRGSGRVQREQARAHRPHPHPGRRVGRPGRARERRLPRMGQDGDGRRGPGGGRLCRCRHRGARPDGPLRHAGRHSAGGGLSGGRRAERLRQRPHPLRGRRVVRRRVLGGPQAPEAGLV